MTHFFTVFCVVAWSLWTIAEPAKTEPTLGPDRIIIVTAGWCGPCLRLKPQIEKSFEALQSTGWRCGTKQTDHIQLVDYDKNKEFCNNLGNITLPYIAKIENGKVVRLLRKPLDQWSLGELHKGYSEKPATKSSLW